MAERRSLSRALSGGAFLRLYVLLALALVLAFGLALLGAALVDKVRRESYREQLAEAPMTLVAEQLDRLPLEFQQPWLDYQASRLGVGMSLNPMPDPTLGFFARSRLEAGKTLVTRLEPEGWLLQRRLPRQAYRLDVRIAGLDEEQMMSMARLLSGSLVRMSARQREARLAQLSNAVLPLTLTGELPEGVSSATARDDLGQEARVSLEPQRWAITLHLRLNRAGEAPLWLVVGPMRPFEPLPGSLLLLLLLLLLGTLAALIYLAVRRIEGRVNRLEMAATRIASGRLDTRVKVEGDDFLARLGMALNGMASRVQTLLQSQQEMIRAVSHELRTPVARLRFAAQMMEDMSDDPTLLKQLEGMDTDIAELDGLVDEILTYARLGSQVDSGAGIATRMIDCRAVAEQVIEALAPLNADRRIALAPGAPVEVAGDPRYLQRALQNLVANACRHAVAEVLICMHAEPGLVRIDVEDDGPGVPQEDRNHIFTPFARLDDSRTRSSGGYGLGLSIVHKIMRWHGGSVVVDSSQRLGGARFSLLLPRQAPTIDD
ncbi:MAG TPA: ATP-binding protein [Halomonas sp.]|nr:ATP-binding protein [Halomonas sp.]